MTDVRIEYRDESIIMSWDGSQASAPIKIDGQVTQYQTADARHRTSLAVAIACRVAWPDVEWPAVPVSGTVDMPSWWSRAEDCEAWNLMQYDTVADEDEDATDHDDPAGSDDGYDSDYSDE